MRVLILLLAVLLPTQAFAYGGWGFAPPERYRGEPNMPVTIIALPLFKIGNYCSSFKRWYNVIYGCAVVRGEKPKKHCVVFIPDKSVPNLAWPIGGVLVVTPKMILTHEKAHCNGWHKSHPR